MNDASPDRHDKFRAYRARKRASGLRELRLWGPDLREAAVCARLRREGALLRNAPEEADAADFIEAAMKESPEACD